MTAKYIGGGFVVGVPARNLTDKEVEIFGRRVFDTGLYKYERPKREKVADEEGEK